MSIRQRSPSPGKPLATAHVLLHPTAPLPRTALLALGVAAALLFFAVADVPMRMRMPMELRRVGGSPAAGSGSAAHSAHHPGCGNTLGSPATATATASGGSGSRLGAGAAPSSGTCKAVSDVAVPSPFARSCTLLRDACVDQERVIVYRPQNSTQPWQLAPHREHAKFLFELADPLGVVDHRYPLPPLHIRPASVREGAAYLQGQPRFSECTVPIVWYPFERLNNFAHLFRDNGARLLGAIQETPWAAQHGKLVVMTAEGTALHSHTHTILQPLFRLRLETWADFSTRLPARQVEGGANVPADIEALVAGAAEARPPLSAEGGPQRCFKAMYVCTAGGEIDVANWPTHGFGLALVDAYQEQLAAWRAQQAQQGQRAGAAVAAAAVQAKPVAASAAAAAAVTAPVGGSAGRASGAGSRTERVLRVLFQRRDRDRLLLNSKELVEQCNRWRHTTRVGQRLRASCAEVEMSSLLSGMAAAQEADVFVGVHGANMANAWLMRPGSSMIELQPYGFDEGAAHLQYPLFNMRDNATGVLWWVLSVCDPAAFTPGADEVAGRGNPAGYAKERNIVLRWDALDAMLQKAAEAGGDAERYRSRAWPDGQWWWWLLPGQQLRLAPAGPQRPGGTRWTKMTCPAVE